MNPTRVLVIEDSPSDAWMVEVALRDGGFEVAHSATLSDGLVALRAVPYACVLLDLGLPDSDGMATLDAVIAENSNASIVVLTGLDDASVGQVAVRRGAQDYLIKGKTPDESLIRAVAYAVERKTLEGLLRESRAELATLVDIAPDAIITIDQRGDITVFNRAAEAMFGWQAAEIVGQALEVLLPLGTAARHQEHVAGFRDSVEPSRRMAERQKVSGRRRDGTVFRAEVAISKIDRRDVATLTAIVRDITERVEAEHLRDLDHASLQARAIRDPLTGLYNRMYMRDASLRLCAADDRNGGGSLGALMIDIDHFKAVNDQLGHTVGDEVLRRVAEIIGASVRPNDVAVRFGGEEFLVLLPDVDESRCAVVGERVRAAVAAGAGDGPVVTVSVGAALRHPGECWDVMVTRADTALYRAKASGRDRVEVAS